MWNGVTTEPESHDTGARVRERGDGGSTQYRIISDFSDPSVTTSHNLPELGFEDGEWTVRDPVSSDQVGGDTEERHGSLQVITVPVVTGNVEDMFANFEGHASSVTDSVVLERTLSNRDWPEPELCTLHSLSSESGPGQEVTLDATPSPSGEHLEQVTVTPPRHESFELNSRPRVYLHDLNESNQQAYAHLDDVINDPDDQQEVRVNIQAQDEDPGDNADDDDQTRKKRRGPNKKLEKKREIQARKEEKQRMYEQAIKAYKDHQFDNVHACAKHFGVCHKSLKKMILEKRGYVGGGRASILTSEEEAKIVAHMKWCREVGFGLTYHSLRDLIQELLTAVVR